MLSDLYYIGKSKISGEGVFASQNIPKGKIVVIMKGERKLLIHKNKKDAMSNPNMVGLGKDLWIDPTLPIVSMNHSCDPNLGTKGTVTFVALRDIKKDEELTFDYSTSEDGLWTIKCKCGSKNCRKIIRGIKYLPLEVYKKYLPYIPRYFQGVYKKYHNLK